MTNSSALRILVGILFVVGLAAGGWIWRHSDVGDPKNIRYVLWKAGLYKMDVDAAVFTMLRDPHRDELVVGKTKDQLRARFRNLQTLEQVSQYYRDGYKLYWNGSDVLFIENSAWMIVFKDDKATTLVLMKGY